VRGTLPLTVLKVLASLACHGRPSSPPHVSPYSFAWRHPFICIPSVWERRALNERRGVVSPDWSNRRHQIQRRAQSRRVPQLGGVLVRVPAALPVCPRAAIHRAAGGHPVFGQRRKGRTFMCQHSCHTYSWHMHFHALLYTHILRVECLSFSLIRFNPGRNH